MHAFVSSSVLLYSKVHLLGPLDIKTIPLLRPHIFIPKHLNLLYYSLVN